MNYCTLIVYGQNHVGHKLSVLGLIHTRHFGTQYCDIAMERYCNKNIFFSSKYCSYISKLFQINRNKIFSIHTVKKKYWLKNVFLSFYRNIFLSQYCEQKCLVCNGPNTYKSIVWHFLYLKMFQYLVTQILPAEPY